MLKASCPVCCVVFLAKSTEAVIIKTLELWFLRRNAVLNAHFVVKQKNGKLEIFFLECFWDSLAQRLNSKSFDAAY